MFKPKEIIRYCYNKPKLNYVPNKFGLLSWNIHKINEKKYITFERDINKFNYEFPINFYLLQEFKYKKDIIFPIKDFCLLFAPNLQKKTCSYGVMTASNIVSYYEKQVLSKNTEFLFNTHKASLISHYSFRDNTPLIIVNVHAINFKNYHAYELEMNQLYKYLVNLLDYPMIIAGDFNSWNKKRNNLIKEFSKKLNLTIAIFEDEHCIKSFGKHPLDLVMYKNVHCDFAKALDSRNTSDHNPLLLNFFYKKI